MVVLGTTIVVVEVLVGDGMVDVGIAEAEVDATMVVVVKVDEEADDVDVLAGDTVDVVDSVDVTAEEVVLVVVPDDVVVIVDLIVEVVTEGGVDTPVEVLDGLLVEAGAAPDVLVMEVLKAPPEEDVVVVVVVVVVAVTVAAVVVVVVVVVVVLATVVVPIATVPVVVVAVVVVEVPVPHEPRYVIPSKSILMPLVPHAESTTFCSSVKNNNSLDRTFINRASYSPRLWAQPDPPAPPRYPGAQRCREDQSQSRPGPLLR